MAATRIVLPERFASAESAAVRAVLLHEYSHHRHGDLWMLAVVRCLLPVLFAHPLFWWLRGRLRLDQEILADAVAGSQVERLEYAELLLAWFRTAAAERAKPLTAVLGLWERPQLLKRRIAMLLNEHFRVSPRCARPWRIASGLLVAVFVVLISGFTLHERSTAIAADYELAALDVAEVGERDRGLITTDANSGRVATEMQVEGFDGSSRDSSTSPQTPPLRGEERVPAAALALANAQYQTADEAFRAGAAFYNAGNYAASLEPFEAALELAPDDAYRLKVYRALMPAYRQLPEIDKMLEACEAILRHTDRDAERSLVRRSLLSFVYQRGKLNTLVERHEDRLKKDADDKVSLYVLSEVYAGLKKNPQRSAELLERLAALEKEEGKPPDVRQTASLAAEYVKSGKFADGAMLYEQIAPQDASLAAWHWKEAAAAWLKAGDKTKALAAAEESEKSEPEKRGPLLVYFWHRQLADAFVGAGRPSRAISHYEKALAETKIEGYRQDTQRALDAARAASP